MTFEEYVNQKDPKKFPDVRLKWEDIYNIWTLKVNSFTIYCMVQLLISKSLFEYFLDTETGVLWTMDNHGNRKNRSCFTLDEMNNLKEYLKNNGYRTK